MSFNVYTHHEINKKILEISPVTHGSDGYLGQLNGYRADEYNLYLEKKRQFFEGVAKYKERNKIALRSNKIKLDADSNDVLRYYEECICEAKDGDEKCYATTNTEGLLLRKRTLRHIQHDKFDKLNVCTLECWFIRYLKLCKFIHAARSIILKNRLLNNLRILKTWDENSIQPLETQQKRIENVSYGNLFEQFIE